MKKLAIGLIRFYQRNISPKTPPSCRFIPTCSAYAIEAIENFGILRGGAMALWRILRCNPLGNPGYDPVPEKTDGRKRRRHKNCNNKESKKSP
jgi:putative membrane protein insertion efficiency factor